MKELINFFIRNAKWFLFVAYMTAGVLLLVNNNPYHQSLYLTSANEVSATVYGWANSVTSYFNLHEANEDLNRRNADLQIEVLALREELTRLHENMADDSLTLTGADSLPVHYSLIAAHVINNSISRPHNYLTINKGQLDGVDKEMGVIDQNGVVGIVNVAGAHNARVISLLNPHFRLSCKIKGDEGFGSLVWDGDDPRYAILEELPKHTAVHPGDTVITSGYSAVFPAGIPVGTVTGATDNRNENFSKIKVRLLGDFGRLSNVQVVRNHMADELHALEAEDKKLDDSDNK